MSDPAWEQKLKAFLKKTGQDIQRVGDDVRNEAQKLMSEVQDAERRLKMKEGLKDVSVWAKRAADDVADLVNTGVQKAKDGLNRAAVAVSGRPTPAPRASRPAPTAKASAPRAQAVAVQSTRDAASTSKKTAAAKSAKAKSGSKAGAKKAPNTVAAKKPAPKKSMGRKA
jgi:hypothetical protein